MEPFDKRGKPSRRSVGRALISLANDENAENIELLHRIELAARYFESSSASDRGDNRNNTVHGYMYPQYWTNESFAELLSDIDNLSPYAGF